MSTTELAPPVSPTSNRRSGSTASEGRRSRPAAGSTTGSSGFRPNSRRRARVAAGAGLIAAAIGGNVLLYSSLDNRTEVLQLVTDLRAGETLTAEHVRIVAVDADPSVPVVPAGDLPTLLGYHARVHVPSGSLLSAISLQPSQLVAPGTAVVAIEIRPTQVPAGIRERSQLELVVLTETENLQLPARAVTRPTTTDGVTGLMTLSVEVASADAARIAAGDDVRVVLREPGADPVYATDAPLSPSEPAVAGQPGDVPPTTATQEVNQ